MIRLINYFLILLLVLFSVLVIAAALLHFADLDPYRETIAKLATRAIGRRVEIKGHLDVNLYPNPEVIFNNVSLANAPWGTEPDMVRVGHLDAAVSFMSLFSDTILVNQVRLKDVTALLEQNDQRVGNWVMGKRDTSRETEETDPEPDEIGSLPVMVDMAHFDNINITSRAPGLTDLVFQIASFSLRPNADGNLDLHSAGDLMGYPMKLDSEISSTETIISQGAVQLDLQASLGDARLKGEVSTSRLATLADLKGAIQLNVEDIQKMLKEANVEAPLKGRLVADISAKEADGEIDLTVNAAVDNVHALATARIFDVEFRDGHITLNIDDIQKLLKDLGVDAPLTGPLETDANVTLDDDTYTATAKTTVEGIDIKVDGSYVGDQIKINTQVAPLKRVGELFDLKGLRADTLKLMAVVKQLPDDAFEIGQFQANIGESQLDVKGRIDTGGESDVSFALASPNLSTVIETLPAIDINAKASALYSAEKIALSDMTVTFDKSDLSGEFTVFMADKEKRFSANLKSALLDLRPFREEADTTEAAATQPAETVTDTPAESTTEPKHRYVFRDVPLELEPLQEIEADVNVAIDQLYYERGELKMVVVEGAVHDGQAKAKIKFDTINDGHAAANIDLQTQGNQASIDTVVSLSDFRVGLLATEAVSQAEVPPLSVSLELKTSGDTPRQLAAAANGKILLTQGPGKVSSGLLGRFSSDILAQLANTLNPFARQDPYTNWECTVVDVNIVDGMASIDGLLAQQEKVMIVGGGDIDLNTEKLNIEFNTKPRKGVGISADMFVTPFIALKGTLAKPAIGLNKKGSLLSGGAAVATGGLSLLVMGAVERTTAQGDKCDEMLEVAGPHTKYDF